MEITLYKELARPSAYTRCKPMLTPVKPAGDANTLSLVALLGSVKFFLHDVMSVTASTAIIHMFSCLYRDIFF
jgi:hypothetical protein